MHVHDPQVLSPPQLPGKDSAGCQRRRRLHRKSSSTSRDSTDYSYTIVWEIQLVTTSFAARAGASPCWPVSRRRSAGIYGGDTACCGRGFDLVIDVLEAGSDRTELARLSHKSQLRRHRAPRSVSHALIPPRNHWHPCALGARGALGESAPPSPSSRQLRWVGVNTVQK